MKMDLSRQVAEKAGSRDSTAEVRLSCSDDRRATD
jgi:hypothetical protein